MDELYVSIPHTGYRSFRLILTLLARTRFGVSIPHTGYRSFRLFGVLKTRKACKVSIPHTGYRSFRHTAWPLFRPTIFSFNPSHGLPIIPTIESRTDCGLAQSRFNPSHGLTIIPTVPVSRMRYAQYGFNPSHGLTIIPTRQVKAERNIEQLEFQSLTRATDHSDDELHNRPLSFEAYFNPSHGLPIIPTMLLIIFPKKQEKFQSLTRATDHSDSICFFGSALIG